MSVADFDPMRAFDNVVEAMKRSDEIQRQHDRWCFSEIRAMAAEGDLAGIIAFVDDCLADLCANAVLRRAYDRSADG